MSQLKFVFRLVKGAKRCGWSKCGEREVIKGVKILKSEKKMRFLTTEMTKYGSNLGEVGPKWFVFEVSPMRRHRHLFSLPQNRLRGKYQDIPMCCFRKKLRKPLFLGILVQKMGQKGTIFDFLVKMLCPTWRLSISDRIGPYPSVSYEFLLRFSYIAAIFGLCYTMLHLRISVILRTTRGFISEEAQPTGVFPGYAPYCGEIV